MKMRRVHEVPLSRQAMEVIEGLRPVSGKRTYVFPSLVSRKALLSENTMNSALRRMGIEHHQQTAHGFRSTASTLLNESGLFSIDAIEAQLAHQDPNVVRRAYNRRLTGKSACR
jgi:integrase